MKLRRACEQKKNYKKGLQVSVKHAIMKSKKEAVTNGRGGKISEILANRLLQNAQLDSHEIH